MLAISTVNMSTGVTAQHPLTVRVCNPGQHPTTLVYCTTKREEPVSSLNGYANPDLALVSVSYDNPLPKRCVPETFPRPQHTSSLIPPPRFKGPAYSDPWNVGTFGRLYGSALAFLQVNPLRDFHTTRHNKYRKGIPGIGKSEFAGKERIPPGRRKNCVPCWDNECESLYRSLLWDQVRSMRRGRSDGK